MAKLTPEFEPIWLQERQIGSNFAQISANFVQNDLNMTYIVSNLVKIGSNLFQISSNLVLIGLNWLKCSPNLLKWIGRYHPTLDIDGLNEQNRHKDDLNFDTNLAQIGSKKNILAPSFVKLWPKMAPNWLKYHWPKYHQSSLFEVVMNSQVME